MPATLSDGTPLAALTAEDIAAVFDMRARAEQALKDEKAAAKAAKDAAARCVISPYTDACTRCGTPSHLIGKCEALYSVGNTHAPLDIRARLIS